MLAVKNSQKRLPRSSERRNRDGTLPAGAPTTASSRPGTGAKLWGVAVFKTIYDNVLYLMLKCTGEQESCPHFSNLPQGRGVVVGYRQPMNLKIGMALLLYEIIECCFYSSSYFSYRARP